MKTTLTYYGQLSLGQKRKVRDRLDKVKGYRKGAD